MLLVDTKKTSRRIHTHVADSLVTLVVSPRTWGDFPAATPSCVEDSTVSHAADRFNDETHTTQRRSCTR